MAEDDYGQILKEAFDKIWVFSTTIFVSNPGEEPSQAGSGTFVSFGAHRCLLTAEHVWTKRVVEPRYANLSLSDRDRRPAVRIPVNNVRVLAITARLSDEWGPDLALIGLPDTDAARLESQAGKAFYSLSRRRATTLAAAPPLDSGLWAVLGTPNEFIATVQRAPEIGYTQLYVEPAFTVSPKVVGQEREGWDYVNLLLFNKLGEGYPREYKGVSGGGLWHFGKTEGSNFVWDRSQVDLEGVAFYHDPETPGQSELIRCHGRRSLYDQLLEMVADGR